MKKDGPATVDEYFSEILSAEAHASLSELRAIILDEVPGVVEGLSYGIPTYKLNGRQVSLGAFKNHCSFFPGHTVRDFTVALASYKVLKGTIQFPNAEPLPEDLVRSILRSRFFEV
jgi:uncharacterized protein YdhG (YjbR/CyaY superfamily)